MTGDAGAYRQFLVSLTPHVRAVARSRCRRFGAPEGKVADLVNRSGSALALRLERKSASHQRRQLARNLTTAALTSSKLKGFDRINAFGNWRATPALE